RQRRRDEEDRREQRRHREERGRDANAGQSRPTFRVGRHGGVAAGTAAAGAAPSVALGAACICRNDSWLSWITWLSGASLRASAYSRSASANWPRLSYATARLLCRRGLDASSLTARSQRAAASRQSPWRAASTPKRISCF